MNKAATAPRRRAHHRTVSLKQTGYVKTTVRSFLRKKHRGSRRKDVSIIFVTVDETHSAGEHPSPTDEFFGVASMCIRKSQKIKNISYQLLKRLNRKDKTVTELRFQQIERKYPIEVDKNLKKMARTGVKTDAVYVDKRNENRPEWWAGIETSERHFRVLLELLDETFSNMKDKKLKVIIDNHEIYKKTDPRELIKELAECYQKDVEVLIEDSKTGKHKELLQAQDCVTYVLGEHVRTGRMDRIKIINMNPKELTKDGRISRNQTRKRKK
ncbi:MAG: hypothetical protein FWH44_02555 [Methanomassiliicoccaceae archaeon]|nr:hypothetical protein [Methanomassiliicoccaceae archaeon]